PRLRRRTAASGPSRRHGARFLPSLGWVGGAFFGSLGRIGAGFACRQPSRTSRDFPAERPKEAEPRGAIRAKPQEAQVDWLARRAHFWRILRVFADLCLWIFVTGNRGKWPETIGHFSNAEAPRWTLPPRLQPILKRAICRP